MEIEAKFSVPNRPTYRTLARLGILAGMTISPAGRLVVADRYLDTDSGRLLTAGYSCRLRRAGDKTIATLKGLGAAEGAVHKRAELEVTLTEPSLNPVEWPDSPARTLALELAGGEPLHPLVDLDQLRQRAYVKDGDRRVAELSLDAVRAAVGNRPTSYYELELELLPGGAEAELALLASELAEVHGLRPESRSKFERALDELRSHGAPVEGHLTAEERKALEALAEGGDPDVARRAATVLAWNQGLPTREIVSRTGLSDGRVRFWLREFRRDRMGIFGEQLSGAPSGQTAQPTKGVGLPAPASGGNVPPTGALRSEPVAEQPGRSGKGREERRALPSVAAFAREQGVDVERARFVAGRAEQLFACLKPVHLLPGKRQKLLRQAALLYTIGAQQDPAHPHRAGRDLILAQPLRNLDTPDRLMLACVVALGRDRSRPEKEPSMAALDEHQQAEAQMLSALLRMATGLDGSGTRSAAIGACEGADTAGVEILVEGPHAEIDARGAQDAAVAWTRLTGQPVVFVTRQGSAGAAGSAAGGIPAVETESSPEPDGVVAVAAPAMEPLRPEEPMSEAGRRLMYLHYQRMLANEPGTRLGEDIEALHDMRVATRRMRAAYRVFEPYFDEDAIKRFNKGLRNTGAVLGAVRDLDVLLEEAEAFRQTLAPERQAGLEPLLADWRARRGLARRHLLKYLDSMRHREFVREFGEFLTTSGAGAKKIVPGEPIAYQVRQVAPRLLMERYEDVRSYEPVLEGAPLTTYHRLRIDFKRLRYLLEFFKDVLGDGASSIIRQTTGVQDLLGRLQDAAVAEGLVREFLASPQARRLRKTDPASLSVIQEYLAEQERLQAELVGVFDGPWTTVLGPSFRKDLALAAAAP